MTGSGTEHPLDPEKTDRPVLRVVKGDPTPAEVAALVAVVAALGAASTPGAASGRRPSAWGSPHRRLRAPLPSDWRSSTLPR